MKGGGEDGGRGGVLNGLSLQGDICKNIIARIATVSVTASVNPCFLKLFEDHEKISEGIENQVTHLSVTKS